MVLDVVFVFLRCLVWCALSTYLGIGRDMRFHIRVLWRDLMQVFLFLWVSYSSV